MTEKTAVWSSAACDPMIFAREQQQLGKFWTLVGVTSDLPNNNDWIRSSLGGRTIFIQRFGHELRGFENICAHRFYPLRLADKGNGHIRCGFHHWQYNKDGIAIGVPKCEEMFGLSPRALNAKLNSVEIAVCGILVFARFPSPEHKETLEDYLGEGFHILSAMWGANTKPRRSSTSMNANWKFGFHISLDDYHLVAVHPDTFGKNGYLPLDAVRYFRFKNHSAYFYGANENALIEMSDRCRTNTYHPSDYRIMQFFPNTVVVHFEAAGHWFALVQQYVPVSFDRTMLRSWLAPISFPSNEHSLIKRAVLKVLAPFVSTIVPLYISKIAREDNLICEHLQTCAAQARGMPLLGRHEERISWFEDVYEGQILVRLNSPLSE